MVKKTGRKTKIELIRELRSLSRRLVALRSMEAEHEKAQEALQERVKELTCLYSIDRAIEEGLSVDQLSARVVESLRAAMQFPEISVAVIELNDKRFSTPGYAEGLSPSLQVEIKSGGVTRGLIRVCHVEEKPFILPFEQNLLNAIAGHLGLWLDHKLAQEALRENEAKFRAVTEHTVSAILIIQGERFRYVNPAMSVITGYTEKELLEMRFWEFAHPEFQDLFRIRALARQRGESAPSRYEFKVLTRSGEDRWVDFIDGYIQFGGKLAIIGTAFDITERKRAEQELRMSREQLRALSARIDSIREEEKTTIAREIHDGFGQELTAIKMDLVLLVERIESGEAISSTSLVEELRSTTKLVDRSIHTVRDIATELRPWAIDTLDLNGALEWQAKEFQTHTGIVCNVRSRVEGFTLERRRTNAIFRILQEALTNIARHAGAHKVDIELRRQEETLVLEVKDDGRGITEEEMLRRTSLGIVSMKERTILLGGELEIRGVKGKGTIVTVAVPMDVQRAEQTQADGNGVKP
ncbi:MAG: PAS domain S-box protein [Ignavibacteria bacterium]|nr:PAS domain S-box protein [Ignavibacteria bacterium]